jgi:acyl-CoA thioesterase
MTQPTTEVLRLDPGWIGWDGLQGGYLAARLLGHARGLLPEESQATPVRALHVSFLAAARDPEMRLSGELLRTGRTLTTVRASLHADGGRPAAVGTAVFGPNVEGEGLEWPAEKAPAVPPATERQPFTQIPMPFARNMEVRPADDRLPLTGGTEPVATAWLRLHTPPADPAMAVMILLDALPPGVYGVLRAPVRAPTIDLATHFTEGVASLDPGEWMLARIRTGHAAGGWCVDDCSLWSESGALLASGRQTRRILPT